MFKLSHFYIKLKKLTVEMRIFREFQITFYFLALFGFFSSYSLADITPFFSTNKEVNFGIVLFRDGNCTLDHSTSQIVDANPSLMCGDVNSGASGTASSGKYSIVANPNKQVEILINQLDNQGNGIIYIPSGELFSDFETIAITPNIKQTINSGTSGIIEIKLGGQLFITDEISSSTKYELTIEQGIEWNEIP